MFRITLLKHFQSQRNTDVRYKPLNDITQICVIVIEFQQMKDKGDLPSFKQKGCVLKFTISIEKLGPLHINVRKGLRT